MISEEMNQKKRGNRDQNVEIVLQNMQKQPVVQHQNFINSSQTDIQQAYQHHKNQILQLKNEIAALKN